MASILTCAGFQAAGKNITIEESNLGIHNLWKVLMKKDKIFGGHDFELTAPESQIYIVTQ